MKKVALIGAGGHARSVIAILNKNQFSVVGIYDADTSQTADVFGIPILGTHDEIPASVNLVLAVGDNEKRMALFEKFRPQIFAGNVFHPSAVSEEHVKCGVANIIGAKAYLNNGVEIGDNNLINTSAILEHEVFIGSHNHISVGSMLLGRAKMGSRCFLGAGAIVRNGVKVCDDVVIGANSYVSEDILEAGIYVGSPARKTT